MPTRNKKGQFSKDEKLTSTNSYLTWQKGWTKGYLEKTSENIATTIVLTTIFWFAVFVTVSLVNK